VAILCGLLGRPRREQRLTTRRLSTTSEFSAVWLAPHDTGQGRRGGAVANLRAASAPRRALHGSAVGSNGGRASHVRTSLVQSRARRAGKRVSHTRGSTKPQARLSATHGRLATKATTPSRPQRAGRCPR